MASSSKTASAIEELKALAARMATASSYEEWADLAAQHDAQSGAAIWRQTLPSSLYDYVEIQVRNSRLLELLKSGSTHELLYALNEGVHGNMGGMGQAVLYGRAKSGTKHLIEEYVGNIAQALRFIARCPDAEVPHAQKLDFFRRASHCYGRSALLLSGGAGLIYFHHGVVQELIDHDLLPNVISGASAGSAIAAQLGIRSDAELKAGHFSEQRYLEATRTSMRDAILGKVDQKMLKLSRERALDEFIPRDLTFQEAYEHTGRYINISISPAEKHQTSRLMNAITSPNVYIRSAVSASSSIPGVIEAERLYAKGFDGKPRPYLASRRWVDGSLSGDLPAKRLSRLYGVNHFIVSMINPAVVPFIQDVTVRRSVGLKAVLLSSAIRAGSEVLKLGEQVLSRQGRLGRLAALQLAYAVSVLDQDYLGDINILLDRSDFKWRQAMFEFGPGEIEQLITAGRRRTWLKLAQLRNAALISHTLDQILEELSREGMSREEKKKHHQYV